MHIQLKGNLIPTSMLQLKVFPVKITYIMRSILEWCPLRSCPHQVNRRAYVPANLPLILNKLFKWNLMLIVYTWWTYTHCLCMFQSILESILLLQNYSRAVVCSISFPIVWCAIIWCGKWTLYWQLNLHLTSSCLACQLVGSWKENMLAKVAINIVSRCRFLICETE